MRSVDRGLPRRDRTVWSISLILVVALLLPCDGLAQDVNLETKAITDLPCPFDVLARLAETLQPGSTPAGLPLKEQLAALKTCVESSDDSSNLDSLLQAIEDINAILKKAPEVTEDLIEWLEKQLKIIGAIAHAAEDNGCEDLFKKLAAMIQALLEPGRTYLSPARPIGARRAAVAVSTAPIVFDTLDGKSVARENRVESWVSWVSAAYGTAKNVEVSLIVPFYDLDLPPSTDPSIPGGTTSGIGDITMGALWQFKGFTPDLPAKTARGDGVQVEFDGDAGHKSVLSLNGSVTVPSGDSKEALGIGYWSWRVGVRADRIFRAGRHVSLIPHGDVWGGGRAGEPRWGAALGLDWPLLKGFGTFVTLLSQSDRFAGEWATYADGRLGFRFRAGAQNADRRRSVQLDGRLSYNRPLNDTGLRPTDWIGAALQITWGGRSTTVVDRRIVAALLEPTTERQRLQGASDFSTSTTTANRDADRVLRLGSP